MSNIQDEGLSHELEESCWCTITLLVTIIAMAFSYRIFGPEKEKKTLKKIETDSVPKLGTGPEGASEKSKNTSVNTSHGSSEESPPTESVTTNSDFKKADENFQSTISATIAGADVKEINLTPVEKGADNLVTSEVNVNISQNSEEKNDAISITSVEIKVSKEDMVFEKTVSDVVTTESVPDEELVVAAIADQEAINKPEVVEAVELVPAALEEENSTQDHAIMDNGRCSVISGDGPGDEIDDMNLERLAVDVDVYRNENTCSVPEVEKNITEEEMINEEKVRADQLAEINRLLKDNGMGEVDTKEQTKMYIS